LAGKAVTDGDGKRLAGDFQAKLPAVTELARAVARHGTNLDRRDTRRPA